MAYDKQLLERLRKAVASESGMSERNMFGGVCISIHGNMACGVQKSDLVVRVGPDAYEDALTESHTRPMNFTGKPMKGFVYVSEDGCRDSRSLKWAARGVRFARSLPRKPVKKPAKKKVSAKAR